jgi:hypothetical protein
MRSRTITVVVVSVAIGLAGLVWAGTSLADIINLIGL